MAVFYWLLLTLLASSTLQRSPANKTIDKLEAGSYVFYASQQQSTHLFMLQFASSFEQLPQFALAINGIETRQDNSTSGFYLTPEAKTATGIIISWKRSLDRWLAIEVNYLASTRKDLLLDHQVVRLSNQSRTLYDVALPSGFNFSKTIVRLFLTGCPGSSLSFDCGVSGEQLVTKTLTIAAYAHSAKEGTQDVSVSFSYILFDPVGAGFSSFGGMFDFQDIVGSQSENIQKVIYRTAHILYGFSTLAFNPDESQNISTTVHQDMLLHLTATNPAKFRLFYVALGKSALDSCPMATEPFEWEDLCVESCPNDTFPYTYSNGGKACLGCFQEMNMTLLEGSCVCKEGYFLDQRSGKCSMSSSKTKAISKTVDRIGVPIQNLQAIYQKMAKKLHSQLQAGRPSITNNGTISNDGGSRIPDDPVLQYNQSNTSEIGGSLPQQLPQEMPQLLPLRISQSLQAPQPQSLSGQSTLTESSPIPLPTFINQEQSRGTLNSSFLDPNAYQFEDFWICVPGYHKQHGICMPINSEFIILPNFVVELPSSIPSQHNQNSSCSNLAPLAPCLPPAYLSSSGQCLCPSGFVMFRGSCVECRTPGVFDYNSGLCLNRCLPNQVFDNQTQRCVCKVGFGIQRQGRCVVCSQGTFLIEGYCVACPDSKVYDKEASKCICPNGTLMDSKGDCINRCGYLEHFDQNSGSCVCNQGLGRVGGRCSLCPPGEIVDLEGQCSGCGQNQEIVAGKCACKKGFILRKQKCVACENVRGVLTVEGECVKCPEGYETQNGQCRCRKDYAQQNNQCLPCGQVKNTNLINGLCLKSQAEQEDSHVKQTTEIPLATSKPSVCSDGITQGAQECDDRNRADGDGCSSLCRTEPGYICQRMPSRCQKRSENSLNKTKLPMTHGISGVLQQRSKSVEENTNRSAIRTSQKAAFQKPVQASGRSSNPGSSKNSLGGADDQRSNARKGSSGASTSSNLTVEGEIKGNTNQIFLTLNTVEGFQFADQASVQKFLKASFEGIRAPTVFFNQHAAPLHNLFDCLLIFPSGVPASSFRIHFYYAKDGRSGQTWVSVDPILISAKTFSRSKSSRERI